MNKRLIAGTMTAALVGTPLAIALAAPANADIDRQTSCSKGGNIELSVDRERGGFEVDADIDGRHAGDRWLVSVRHDGKVVARKVIKADREGEVDLELYRPNSAGKDAFQVRARNLDTRSLCVVRVTTR